MPEREQAMTAKQYVAACDRLGWTPYAAAGELGVSVRQSLRYAAGDQVVPPTVARLLRALQALHKAGLTID